MEHRYYRDLKHSYAIVDVKEDENTPGYRYQLKVLEGKRVKKLLPCSLRQINDDSFLYYDVTSMMSLEDRFSVKKMNYEQVRALLTDMKNMLESMSEFLLGEEGIIFEVGSVFTGLSSNEFGFMFFPYSDENPGFAEFCEELLEYVDYEDDRASTLIYELCERAKEEGAMILSVIDDVLGIDSETDKGEDVEEVKETYEEDAFDYTYEEQEEVPEPAVRSRMKMSKEVLGGKTQLLFSLLFACVIGAVTYIRMNYILSEEENLLSMGVMLVSGITGVVAFISGTRGIRKAKEEYRNGKKHESRDDYADDYDDEDYAYEDVYRSPIKITSSFKTEDSIVKNDERVSKNGDETMVLECDEDENMTLYSRNLDKTVRISLDKLPVVIGKMEGCVDKIISDMSVSRIHCKFVNDGKRVAIMDLGSTNGTFKNGVRLSPKEKNYIEEGDEIKIGRVCFDCR
ncbi:DUF6382 domain-containing protein [Butyrivibrio sp. INlla21]|uniref:DUF6382 domain-containing protein n=1 Tax=Butyrivibrio sp. INlla21 TaxID=1520811 RepID=UPI0008E49A03|nr:DUF6382 domain-containing protein [Butyrivibrio sp. INlla21]SFU61947.1 FHA domain-containing protein [Butyrivibrio sp. INlla21]